jgi:hypothetical protein
MRTITVPVHARTINSLLRQARETSLILQAADGRRFVLAALGGWQGFEIGDDEDFGREVERTVENKDLMNFLAQRRQGGRNIPLAEVKARHGLEVT